ncbi:AraC family transcriptional regulator [Aestuariispira ectoiniformans]|uniref:AraC family transcriptional regulator n=1 Tax=Aestuariispira ectoiniformans TaxID=2775080 RepID=UPI00223AC329|nr:AraC family transcriptional regulator [Aestuariispira ectoiniformans]
MSNRIRPLSYEDRLTRVTDYIFDHLDDDIDLNHLAEVACMSPYHWHRVFHAVRGETIAAFVKRMRLNRAAGDLARTTMPVEEIANRSGYKTVQSFNRSFKAVYGMPPIQYRKYGNHTQFQSTDRERLGAMYDVEIKSVPAMTAITMDHRGSYMEIGKAFESLYGWLGARNMITPDTRMVGLYYDDPSSVAEADLRSKAGAVCPSGTADGANTQITDIRGGEYAILHYKGPYAAIQAAYQWFYGEWLTSSGREAADAPCFEEYLNSPRDTAPNDLLTDICLPLR